MSLKSENRGARNPRSRLLLAVRPEELATEENGYFVQAPDNLYELSSTVIQFMRRFGIGQRLDPKKWGKTRAGKIQKAIQKAIDPQTLSPETNPAQLMKKLEDEIRDPANKFGRDDFERVARTEVAAIRAVFQLKTAQQLGIKYVNHVTRKDQKVSDICQKLAQRSPLLITHLLRSEKDRIPAHPNCRCRYQLIRRK